MPGASTITVAWTDGANAEEIALTVAEKLNYRFVSDDVIERAARSIGVGVAEVYAAEHRESLATRILRSLSSLQLAELGDYNGVIVDQSPAYREAIKDVIRAFAAEGSCVIGLHGAGITLAGTPRVLRVFITAPIETRIARLAQQPGGSEKLAREAAHKTDADRKDYFRKFFGIDDERPTHYDLVINTGVLSTNAAVTAILAAANEI